MAVDITEYSTRNGHWVVAFDSTAVNGTEPLKSKDSTSMNFYIEKIQMTCGSGASAALFDGSAGTKVFGHLHCASGAMVSADFDSVGDPLVLDGTTNMCITGAADGFVQGTIQGYTGT